MNPYASLQIEQGVTPKRLQKLMGHTTLKLTLDTYGHLWPDKSADRARARAVENVLQPPRFPDAEGVVAPAAVRPAALPFGGRGQNKKMAISNSREQSVFGGPPVAPSWHPQKVGRFGTPRKSSETIGFSRLLSEAFENGLFAKASRPLFSFDL
jgi:hypothetical protein